MLRVVLDTHILVAGLRSRRGASYRVLSLLPARRFDVVLSVPLVLEYEDALMRAGLVETLTQSDVEDVLDYLCQVGVHQEIFYLWRPLLRDPKDDMVVELAVAGGCDAIVTFNCRDFEEASNFAVRVLTPQQLLTELGEQA